jgi:serpin B
MLNKKLRKICVVGTVTIALVVAGVLYQDILFPPSVEGHKIAIDTNATNESVDALVEAINEFSLELYATLCNGTDGNMFFSPYSIFVALAMTYEGARNETAQEMYDVLGFQQNNDSTLCSFGKIYNLLNIDAEYTLHTANALWTQENYSFLQEYLYFVDNYYMGKAIDVDFNDADYAAQVINQWIKDNTGGKLKNMLSNGDISPLTRLILTNAIYFKGDWQYQFPKENTQEKTFEIAPNDTVDTPMMKLYDDDIQLKYLETDHLQVLELPYESDELSMIIFLPKESTISILDSMLTYDNFTQWKNSLTNTNVEVLLPKFKLETEYKINQALMDMGMRVPFTSDADFSGMNGNRDLFLEKVLHKAFIEVNEEGTEAAAATSVHMSLTAWPNDIVFNANHPFTFLIQQQETGTILFMGKVCNPQ